MDKKYYSNRHRKYNKKTPYKRVNNTKKQQPERSAFLMRLNISLGIAIVAIGFYKMNNEFSNNLTATYKELVGGNISFGEIKKDFSSITNFRKSIAVFGSDNSIKLNESTIEFINNDKDIYAENNSPAVSP